MNKKPNIVYFVADQMRNDSLHHMGNQASITPNLDQLLEEGVSFENAYCQNPVCVPSRCSFLTGLYPHTTGHRTMHYLQNEDEPNILKEMKQNGYEVIWVGRNDVIPANRMKSDYCDAYFDGFHEEDTKLCTTNSFINLMKLKGNKITNDKVSLDDDRYYSFYIGKTDEEKEKENMDWKAMASVLKYLDDRAKRNEDRPFFLYITITFPHPPYGCEDPWYSSIDRNGLISRRPNVHTLKDKPSMLYQISEKQKMNQWTEERWNELRATYLAMVSRFDYHFGLVANKLKEHNLYEETSIFVFSDHGDYTGDYAIVEKVQNCFENPISNVPLIVKPASKFKCVPRKSKALVELVDLSATIAEMAEFKLSYTQFGKSLIEAIAGSEDHKDAVFCEGGRVHGEEHCMEKGHGPESQYYPRLSTQSSEGPEHTKATMIRMGNLKYTMRLYEKDELYDLEQDPNELYNEIENEKYAKDIAKLQKRLLQYYMETGDFVPIRKDMR